MTTRPENNHLNDAATGRPRGDASQTGKESRPIISVDSPIFKDVHVTLDAALGRANLSVQEILALKSGSVVKLDMKLNDLVELWLNESLIARGEIVAVDGSFAVRIVEIAQIS